MHILMRADTALGQVSLMGICDSNIDLGFLHQHYENNALASLLNYILMQYTTEPIQMKQILEALAYELI
jgi:hypothetical protein